MPATYEDRNAVYALNRYVMKLLEANLGWDTITYTNSTGQTISSTRIIPSAQQPELLATGKTFMVYGSAIDESKHLYALTKETVAYTIYSPSSTEVNKVSNFLYDVFKRQDDAVADLNAWLDFERLNRGVSRNLSFAGLLPTMTEKAEPADEEGGYVSAMFMLDTQYVVQEGPLITRPQVGGVGPGLTYP